MPRHRTLAPLNLTVPYQRTCAPLHLAMDDLPADARALAGTAMRALRHHHPEPQQQGPNLVRLLLRALALFTVGLALPPLALAVLLLVLLA